MIVITAVIQPLILNKVTNALDAIEGFPGMTIAEAQRFARGRRLTDHRVLQIDEFKEKVCIEIVTEDEKARQILDALVRTARTGNSGDGKVFALPIESDARSQTCETCEVRTDATLTLLIFDDFRIFHLAANPSSFEASAVWNT